MLETPRGLAKVGDGNCCAEYLCGTKGMARWRLPTCQAKTSFFTRTIVLDDERIVLREFWNLYIGALPLACPAIRAPQFSRRRAEDGDAALFHGCAIGLDIIGGQHEIKIAFAFGQPLKHSGRCFLWPIDRDQFDIGIADHNNAIGSTAGGMDTSARYCQPKFLAEYLCRLFQVMHTDDNMIQPC